MRRDLGLMDAALSPGGVFWCISRIIVIQTMCVTVRRLDIRTVTGKSRRRIKIHKIRKSSSEKILYTAYTYSNRRETILR